MIKSKTLTNLNCCSLTVLLFGAASLAYAHTGIKDKVFTEGLGNTGSGATAYNAFTITHGCASNERSEDDPTPSANIIAMAAVFPNSINASDAKVYRYETGTIDSTTYVGTTEANPLNSSGAAIASPADLSDDIDGASAENAFNNFGLSLVSPNLFGNNVVPILDSQKNARGYIVYNGPNKYDKQDSPLEEDIINTTGLSVWKHTIPVFKSTSCAKSLEVRVAVGNWCKKGPKYDADSARMDVWVGAYTDSAIYNMTANPLIMPNSAATLAASPGKDFWPRFTVNRDEVNNPFQGACTDPANQYDVVIEPKGTDVDTYLRIPKGKYPHGVNGPEFWPH